MGRAVRRRGAIVCAPARTDDAAVAVEQGSTVTNVSVVLWQHFGMETPSAIRLGV